MIMAVNRFVKFTSENAHEYKIQSLKLFVDYNEIMDESFKKWILKSIQIPLQAVS